MPDLTPRLRAALGDRYAFEQQLAEGGMAIVYLARDLRHNRRVAIKVLRPELGAVVGAERFLSEIEVTAGLQHPHILPLFDSGEADGLVFYVMPWIEGETLRQRLDREKELPVHEAVHIAVAIAQALEHAHRRGVVHRDVKPGNILLQEGEPLVADFGIALAVGAAGAARLTETGLSVGTPYYMSPEQATGERAIGPQSDVYSLAGVLYEMLVGIPPFQGATAQAVLGKIIASKPVPPREGRPLIPPNVDAAIRRGLERKPADRFTSAQAFAQALEDPAFRHDEESAERPTRRSSATASAGWALSAVLAGALLLTRASAGPEEQQVRRLAVPLDPAQELAGEGVFDVSRDGVLVVYEGPGSDDTMLWSRRLDALEGAPIIGTEGASSPSVSPDGLEVAFVQNGAIRVVSLMSGAARTLDAPVSEYVRWGPEGRWLYFNDRSGGTSRVPSEGGPVEEIARADPRSGVLGRSWASGVRGTNLVIYEVEGAQDNDRIEVVSLDDGSVVDLGPGQFPRYSDSGHLVYVQPNSETVLAAPFDPHTRALGDPRPIARDTRPAGGWKYFAVSAEGTLIYAIGASALYTPVEVERSGSAHPIDPGFVLDPGTNNRGLALSPNGARLALTVARDGHEDIWIRDLPDGPFLRLTVDAAQDVRPRWSPDGTSIIFISDRDGNAAVYRRNADGSGDAERIAGLDRPIWEAQRSPDGAWLVLRVGGDARARGGRDILGLPAGGGEGVPLIAGVPDEKAFALSPDGGWIAYESDETGRDEIYVRGFPDVDRGKWVVSVGGGVMPVWSRSGEELFYVGADGHLTSARVDLSGGFEVRERTALFRILPEWLIDPLEQYAMYDVAPDDGAFILLQRVSGAQRSELVVVEAWARLLDPP